MVHLEERWLVTVVTGQFSVSILEVSAASSEEAEDEARDLLALRGERDYAIISIDPITVTVRG